MNHREKPVPPWAEGRIRQAIGSPRVKAVAVHPLPIGSIVLSPTQSTHEAAIHRRSVCLTACHSIFPSPSLTGWTAIHLGVYQCRFFLGSADASHKLTRPDGCRGKTQEHRNAKAACNCSLVVILSNSLSTCYRKRQKACANGLYLVSLTTATEATVHEKKARRKWPGQITSNKENNPMKRRLPDHCIPRSPSRQALMFAMG